MTSPWGQEKGDISKSAAFWEKKADEHQQKQLINPFSNWEACSNRPKFSKDDVNYGRPVEGSKTEYRGKKAGVLVGNEIVQLCHIIAGIGVKQPNDTFTITFGELFEAYEKISNKLVGMLMRARRHKLLDFKGEMLFQRRDEDVVITVSRVPDLGDAY